MRARWACRSMNGSLDVATVSVTRRARDRLRRPAISVGEHEPARPHLLISFAGARARQIVPEALAGPTYPAHLFRWHAGHERVVWHRPGHDRTGGDKAIVTETVAADDRGIGAD